jgi:hypothetical protein
MPRAQNAHAYVNAGFLFRLNVNNGGKVLAKPTIVYGGINPQFVSIMMMMMMMIIKSLYIAIQRLWNMKCIITLVITGAIGTVIKGLKKNLEAVLGNIQ